MSKTFLEYLSDHESVVTKMRSFESDVNNLCNMALNSVLKGGKIMFCGNGGSAADSQHLAAELSGRLIRDRPPIAGIALTTDTSAITCISNDYGYEEIFSRQIEAVGKNDDTLILISTSGNSRNLIKAAIQAKKMGIQVLSFLGKDGGELLGHSDASIVVPSDITARIQEMHILIGHVLCREIELGIYPEQN